MALFFKTQHFESDVIDITSHSPGNAEEAHAYPSPEQVAFETRLSIYLEKHPLPKPKSHRILQVQVVVLASLLVLSFYLLQRSAGYQQALRDSDSGQNRTLGNLNQAVANHESALRGASSRLEEDSRQLARLSRSSAEGMQKLDQKITAEDRALRKLSERVEKLEKQPLVVQAPAAPAPSFGMSGQHSALSPVTAGPMLGQKMVIPTTPSNAHIHGVNMLLPKPKGALLHTNAMNEQDYWLMPRDLGTPKARLSRVLPYESIPAGVRVHDIDDGNDYILTPDGQWLNDGKH